VLRKRFFEAKVGLSGVNFAMAETGTLLPGGKRRQRPHVHHVAARVHVAVMGLEKVVENWRKSRRCCAC
jgi:L-lactate dehydrogenase complex protein LldF